MVSYTVILCFPELIYTKQILVHRWGGGGWGEQLFWGCFTDELQQSLVSCVVQASGIFDTLS